MLAAARILLIEDRAEDVELIVIALRKGGLDPVWERVETAEELVAALDAATWDAVLSDYTLPGFSVGAALEIVRSADPDVPFIVVSGTCGEEVAVELLRAGANDYVLKQSLIRLAAVVEREIRETANRRAKRAAEKRAEHFAAMIASSEDAIQSQDLDGLLTEWNPAAERLFGWRADEVIGRNGSFLIPANKYEEYTGIVTRLKAGEYSGQIETVRLHRGGQRLDVTLSVSPIRDADGRIIGVSKISRDISARKKAEAERDDLFQRLNLQIERMPLAYLFTDATDRYIRWNPAAERIFGFTQTEALGKGPFDLIIPPQSRAQVAEIFVRLRTGDMNAHGNSDNLTKGGRTICCEWLNTPLFAPDGTFEGILSLAQDITARREAERVLQLRDHAIGAVMQGIIITDPNRPDNPIIYASPGFARMTGYSSEEVLGRNCRFLHGENTDAAVVAQLREAIRLGESIKVELLNYRKDGTPFWNELSISPVRDEAGSLNQYIGVQADITARRHLEEQFRQVQKMEAVGQLAGGVAHDFNNLLTIINGYSELVLQDLPVDDPSWEMVSEIRKAGNRSAELTRQLLAFSRQQVLAPRILDLNAVAADMDKMLRRLIGEDIQLVTKLDPELGITRADPGQIDQVLMNLAVNARDAMPQGGRLTIETQNVTLDKSYTQTHVDARPGDHVLLSVSDTGSGIPPEVLVKIFEPFFTTKGVGQGTGLGLATVYGIVKQSGGHLAVYSEVGHGTTFKVYLPRVEQAPDATQGHSWMRTPPRGTETVLIVEDEDGVRALTSYILSTNGYTVLEACEGEEAVSIASSFGKPIHLLITDVVMPGSGGRIVAEQVRERYPAVKVLFVSGYTDDAVIRHGVLQAGVHFMQKPFSPAALANKVREILDGAV